MIFIVSVQRYDKKNNFIFDPDQDRETNWNFIGCQVHHLLIVLKPYINSLRKHAYSNI